MTESVEDIQEITDALASKSKSIAADGVSKSTHSIPDLLALEERRAAQVAAKSSSAPFRMFKTKPPGAL